MRFTAALILVFLGAFTGTALAASAVAPADGSILELARPVFDAVMHGQWWAAAAFAVVLGVTIARRWMPAAWKQGAIGDITGTATAFVLAFAGAIGTWAIAPGATMTLGVLATATKIGVAAIGGYNIVHKLLGWLAAWSKTPAWLVPVLKLVASLVGSGAIAKAEAAGAAAVAASPSKGMAGDSKVIEVE